MAFTLLKVAEGQSGEFVAAKPAGEQKCKQRPISFTLHCSQSGACQRACACSAVNQLPSLTAQLLDALDSPYSCGQVGAEKPAICRLVRKAAHGSETKIDRAWSEIARLQMHSIPDDNCLAEGQPRLGTIPIHKFVDRVPVSALRVGAGKAVEHRGLCDFEVR